MDDYLEEPSAELTPEMKDVLYGIKPSKNLSISKILIIASIVIVVLIAVNIWSGVQEVDIGLDSDLQGELFQEKGLGNNIDILINDTNETSQNNSVNDSDE